MTSRTSRSAPAVVLLIAVLAVVDVGAQDLEPRAFSPAPVGLHFGVLAYAYSSGNIFFDPALPIAGAEGQVHSATLGYVRTLSLVGRSAKVAALVPYAWGDWNGDVDGTNRTRVADGFADPAIQLSVIAVGAPAFAAGRAAPRLGRTLVGVGIAVQLPLGQYDPDRLINLGSNRWVFVPRLGISHRTGAWTLEANTSASFYTDNDDAYQDTELSQAPLWSLVVDAVYQFRPGLWAGIAGGVGAGARTTIDGVPKDTYQQNLRLGAVVAYPLTARASLKALYLHNPSTERGADFDTVSLAYQVRWGG